MSSAGQLLVAGRVPGELIGETVETADSSTFTTTPVTVISLTVPLVAGRTYKLTATIEWRSSVADDRVFAEMREDNATGTVMQSENVFIRTTASTGYKSYLEARYTAVSSANKTFVVTGDRVSGTGSCAMEADTTRPSILSCYYHSG